MNSLIKQQTINKEFTLKGTALHSGDRVKLRILPAKDDSGIKFIRTDKQKNNIIQAIWNNVKKTNMQTVISNDMGVSVATIEHLMSAISSFEIDNLTIEINGPEVPILDGSANEFCKKINKVGVISQTKNKKFIKILKNIKFKLNGKRYATLSPSRNNFQISCHINFPNSLICNENYEIDINKNSFLKNIAAARTFGFKETHSKLKKMGLAKGASMDNCIVIDKQKILNKGGLRFKNEFVRHKVLDACGDLYLAGHSILGQFLGYQSGHYVNNELLKKLFSDKSAFAIVHKNLNTSEETNVVAMSFPKQIAS